MITRKQIGGVYISPAPQGDDDASRAKVVEIQAGCSFSLLTRDQLIQLRTAIDKTIAELNADRAAETAAWR